MFNELLVELRFVEGYLETLLLLKDTDGMKASKEAVDHAIKLVKIIKDRIEIAESKIINGSTPEARAWKDIKTEYEVIYHLERLYNGSTQLEQPDKCKFFDDADCCYPIGKYFTIYVNIKKEGD